jgi:glycosyltransferase involved in cell wall biosynthesis
MKLGFQGWFLSQPHTGIGQHSLGLLKALAATKKVELTVVSPAPVKIPGLKVHTLRPKTWLPHPALKKWVWERVQVPAYFARHNLDWEYYPYPCPLPARSSHLRAMTVHDLILWDDPRYQGSRLKRTYYRQAKRALVHVDQLFTVSHATHDELGIPAAKILPNAAPEIPTGLSKKPYQNDFIYIGGYDLRKNVTELVRQFVLYQKTHAESRLLLVGVPHHRSRYYPAVPSHPSVLHLGRLSEKELYSALKSSKALLHFSDQEGFNIPLLQALSVGTPAVVKDLPVNREVSHGAALFLKGSLSATLKKLEDPQAVASLRAAGRAAAKQYSWPKSAQLFLKALRK